MFTQVDFRLNQASQMDLLQLKLIPLLSRDSTPLNMPRILERESRTPSPQRPSLEGEVASAMKAAAWSEVPVVSCIPQCLDHLLDQNLPADNLCLLKSPDADESVTGPCSMSAKG